jgi:hypothetical protein
VDCTFDDAGDLVQIETTTRSRGKDGPMPWSARFMRYGELDGVRVLSMPRYLGTCLRVGKRIGAENSSTSVGNEMLDNHTREISNAKGASCMFPSDTQRYSESEDAKSRAALRYTLGALLAFGALNAFGGGYYGLMGAKDIPKDWLEGSPFTDYFFPSLILFVVVGGSLLLTAIAVFARWRMARLLTLVTVAIVLGWIGIQVAIIGYVSWMQPLTVSVAGVILALASLIGDPKDWRQFRRETT